MKLRLSLLLFVFCGTLFAQEHIAPLHSNPQVRKAYTRAMLANNKSMKKTTAVKDTVSLPFLDDFSKPGPYPDTTWWLDSNVYVNYNLPTAPHTLGVATFDGLNKRGMPYNKYASAGSSLPADTLTSKPIKWPSNSPAFMVGDSVYLSFYYQEGTRFHGDTNILFPKQNDSLILQFRNPAFPPGKGWTKVWSQTGTDTIKDSNFRYVLIPIKNPWYLTDGFQFRFVNYACTSGNLDHWSIDEVYLDKNRHFNDTTQADMSFVYEFPGMLAHYQAMPWEQFTGLSDLKSSFTNLFRNNSNTVINASYFYDTIPGFLMNYAGGAYNEAPYYSSGYCGNAAQANPPFDYVPTLPILTGPTFYKFTEYLYTGAGDFNKWNDTLHYTQVFGNYFAYDDGSPECAWFVNPFSSGIPTYVAQEFTLNKPDTLVAVQMYFDYVLVNSKVYPFHFAIWNDNGGVPGTMIFEDTARMHISTPAYDSSGINVFTQFILDSNQGIPLPAGKVYIGWVQVSETGSDSINIGMDLNNNNADKIFICTNPVTLNWQNSLFPGSLMLRPVFGPKNYSAVNEINSPDNSFALFPNPTNGIVEIQANSQWSIANSCIKVFNTLGEEVYSEPHISNPVPIAIGTQFSIDLSSLPPGFYIVQLNTGNHSTFKKLIISK